MVFTRGELHEPKTSSLYSLPRCLTVASPPDIMSEILVPLLELPVTKKAPAGKLPSKADFLCLLYGSVEGNFEGFQGKIFLSLLLH